MEQETEGRVSSLCIAVHRTQLAHAINTYRALGSLSLALVVRSVVDCSRCPGILH